MRTRLVLVKQMVAYRAEVSHDLPFASVGGEALTEACPSG